MTPIPNRRARARPARFLFPRPATRAALRAIYRVSPGHSVALVTLSTLAVATGLVQMFVIARLVGAIAASRSQNFLGLLASIGVLSVANTAARNASGFCDEVIGQRLRGDAERRLMALNMGPAGIAHLEDPAYQDFLEIAQGQLGRSGAANSVWGITESFSTMLTGLTRAAVLLAFGWWAPLLLAAAAILLHRTARSQFENLMKGWHRDAEHLRRADYLRELTLSPSGAKEVRVFGLKDWLIEGFSSTWLSSMRAVWRERAAFAWQATAVAAGVAAALGIVVWRISDGVVSGSLTLESLMVMVPSAIGLVESGLFSNAQVYATGASMSLLTIEEAEAVPVSSTAQLRSGDRPATGMPAREVRFERVWFRYPGADIDVFSGLDLTIEAGSSVAIVGANGAGKTTLIKLLARLYEPTAGRITVDGIDIAELDVGSWRKRLAMIFQDFARWKLSVRDNVGFGALDLLHDDDSILEALDRAQADSVVAELPTGLDTVLSPEFGGGIDLSGGQWQRIALARAVIAAGRGGLLVLDEPTASQDVRAEAQLFDRFIDVTRGTTTLLISHRFSTVRHASRIVVINEGRVIEDGPHHALLAAAGHYARMYELQAGRYVDLEGDVQ